MEKTRTRFLAMFLGFAFLMMALGCATTQETTTAATPAPAQEKPEWFYDDIVDVTFVKEQIKVPMPENVRVIDSRPYKAKFIKGHIPMAVSIPDSKFDKMTGQLPADKTALLVFYCQGPTWKLSHKSARKAEKLGYTNVKVFADGLPAWVKAGNYPSVSVEWVKKQIDSKADMTLVDSRPKRKKFDKGHIPGAVNIPDMYFDKQKDQLPAEKDKLIVFYCEGPTWKLSHKSAWKAIGLGYTNVKVFTDGYPAWVKYVGKDTAAKAPAPTKVKAGAEEGSIDIEYFKETLAGNPGAFYLIDVRDPDEFATGTIKGAKNIPVDGLEAQIPTLPTDKPIVFICGTGARSGESFYMVQDVRPELKNVFYVDAEMTVHEDGTFTLKRPAM